jgi:hypothetical protein
MTLASEISRASGYAAMKESQPAMVFFPGVLKGCCMEPFDSHVISDACGYF